jgi:riboflavin biosynthesis pyrimidine reductase
MSTTPDSQRADDQIVTHLSHWLTRQLGNDELRALAADGVQSLLLEGGPTLAASFLEADLVDKILLFTAPTLAGAGPTALPASLPSPRTLVRLSTRQIGADVLLEAYVHDS